MTEENTRQFMVNYWCQNFKQKEKIIEASKISSDLNRKNSYMIFLIPPTQNFDINTYGSAEMGWNLSQFNLLLGFTFKVMIQPAMKTSYSYSNFQWNTSNNSMSFNESSLLAKSKRKVNWVETKLRQFAELADFIPVIITWETTLLPGQIFFQ